MRAPLIVVLVMAAGLLATGPAYGFVSAASASGTVSKAGCTVTISRPTMSAHTHGDQGSVFVTGSVRCNRVHRHATIRDILAFYVPIVWSPRIRTAPLTIPRDRTVRMGLKVPCLPEKSPTRWRARFTAKWREGGRIVRVSTPWRYATADCV